MSVLKDKLLLGVDIGTNEFQGRSDRRKLPPHRQLFRSAHHGEPAAQLLRDGCGDLWSDFCRICRGLMEQAGVGPEQIAGVGTSVMGCDCIPWTNRAVPCARPFSTELTHAPAPRSMRSSGSWAKTAPSPCSATSPGQTTSLPRSSGLRTMSRRSMPTRISS